MNLDSKNKVNKDRALFVRKNRARYEDPFDELKLWARDLKIKKSNHYEKKILVNLINDILEINSGISPYKAIIEMNLNYLKYWAKTLNLNTNLGGKNKRTKENLVNEININLHLPDD